METFTGKNILVTGGAGFIGSNLCEWLLINGNRVVCLDNLSTGKQTNIDELTSLPGFTFIKGDVTVPEQCSNAVKGIDIVFHQAALGSVPRSIKDPAATNRANTDGFLNMLIAARDEGIKRFVYAASSSTYGDSKEVPKMEERIGRPLSPYAVTKLVNELYASVFSSLYGIETIGLRYFNVFGRRQDPDGAYAAVIPLWVKSLISLNQPVINGNGSFSRDFTYIDNVIEANILAAATPSEAIRERLAHHYPEKEPNGTVSEIFNVAYGANTTLTELFSALRTNLALFDQRIGSVEPLHGPEREGDIPHSLASVEKAQKILNYNPLYDAADGFALACEWYYNRLKNS